MVEGGRLSVSGLKWAYIKGRQYEPEGYFQPAIQSVWAEKRWADSWAASLWVYVEFPFE